jgi:hypothetical protein
MTGSTALYKADIASHRRVCRRVVPSSVLEIGESGFISIPDRILSYSCTIPSATNASKLAAPSSCHTLLVKWIIRVSLLRRISAVKGIAIIRIQLQTLCKTLGQIRVRDEPATEDDEVGIARLELGRRVVTVEAARCDEFDATFCEDLAELDERVATLGFHGRFGFDAFATRVGVCGEGVHFGLFIEDFVEAGLDPEAVLEIITWFLFVEGLHMYVCRPHILRQRRDLVAQVLPVLVRIAVLGALEVIVWTKTDTNTVGANGFRALLDNFKRKAGATFDGSTILIRPLVHIVVEESPLRQNQLHALSWLLLPMPWRYL